MASAWIFAFVALFINVFGWLFAALLETEVFYDLVGGITFVVVGLISYWLRASPPAGDVAALAYSFTKAGGAAMDPTYPYSRQRLATILLMLWTLRLAGFLFARAMAHGDRRFDKYKTDPLAFLTPFMMQAAWCFFDALPLLVINGSGAMAPVGGWWDAACLSAWAAGHLIEIVADWQKWAFKASPANRGKFIATGLWAYSRHPNYFGQIVLNWSFMLFCLPGVWAGSGYFALALVLAAPAFETLLILKVSGIPMLESAAKKKWGEDDAFRRYMGSVSVLVPMLPKRKPGASKKQFT